MFFKPTPLTIIPVEGCVGFTFRGGVTEQPVEVFYKDHTSIDGWGGWTSYLLKIFQVHSSIGNGFEM